MMKSAVRKQTTKRNPEQTRERLLLATVEILAQRGEDGLSLKEAALLAKVSRGVAYQHFRDRDHLLHEAKEWITNRLVESMSIVDPATADVQLLQMSRLILFHRDAATLLVSEALAGRALASSHPVTGVVRRSLENFRSSGLARPDIDVDILTYIFLGMVATQIMLSRLPGADKEQLAQRFTRELSAFMRHGIYSPTPIKKRRK